MKKDVSLKIKSSQYAEKLKPSGEAFRRELELEDSMEIRTEGTLYDKDGIVFITYEESKEAGLENMKTLLKYNGTSLKIHRYSKDDNDDMDMTLQKGILNITRYKIPQVGSIDLEIYTNDLAAELDEEGYGRITVDYKISFDQFFSRRTILEIEISQ